MTKLSERFVPGVIVAQKAWSDELRSLYVTAPIEPFVAGQFTQLSLDEEVALFRPYSFVNANDQSPLEFYYSILPTGKFTQQLARLKPGDRLFVAKRASGRFVLETVPDAKVLWLFATGTGLGVFLSMLQTPLAWQRFQKVVLVHSVQKASSLTHLDLVKHWQKQYGNQFYWIPTITGATPQSGILSQRITALLLEGYLEKIVECELSITTSQTMLCGNPAMVKDLSELLIQRGLQMNHPKHPGHITVENYWKLDNRETL
ncbi:MAG: ferredoxin--NADP reductase [Candidatus Berkiella sp.]